MQPAVLSLLGLNDSSYLVPVSKFRFETRNDFTFNLILLTIFWVVPIQDILQEAISYGKSHLKVDYIELRHLKVDRTTINLKDGKGKAIHGIDSGTAIRVLVDGAWGFVSVASSDLEAIKARVKDAAGLAKLGAAYTQLPVSLYPTDPHTDVCKIKWREDPREVPTYEKKNRLEDLHSSIIRKDEKNRIKSTEIAYADITGLQHFQNSDNVEITMDKCITWARFLVNGKDGIIRAGARHELGSPLGYWVFKPENLSKIETSLYNRVIQNLEAKPGKGGDFPAIMGPPVAGVFAHEACGHLFEADLTESGVIGTSLGKKIGSEQATIIDDGTHPDGIGTFPYDDEGTPSQKTTILEKGIVSSILTDREYSSKFIQIKEKTDSQVTVTPSGNARAFDFRVAPIIRMRNTYFDLGDYSWDELLEGIKFGYYLVDFRGGQASPEGTFTVGVQEAYEIVNGELGSPVRGISISGNTLKTIHGISAAGKDDFSLNPGRCGKGQTAFTGDGGPNIRVDSITVAGEK